MKKKLFSILMSIMLVAVYMPALTFSSYAATQDDWSTTTSFEDGEYYLIVASGYALTNNNGSSVGRTTLNNSYNNSNCFWKASVNDGNVVLSNAGKYLTGTATYSSGWRYSLSISNTQTKWKTSSNKLQSSFSSGLRSTTGEIKYSSTTSPFFSLVKEGSGTSLTFYKYTGKDPLPLDIEYDKTVSYDVAEGDDLKITLKNTHGNSYNYTITSTDTEYAKVNNAEAQTQSISSNGTKEFNISVLKPGTVTLNVKNNYSTPETCTITLNIKGDVSKYTATVDHFICKPAELKIATSLAPGKTYVIASDTHALKNNNGTVAAGTITKLGDDALCDDTACFWTAVNSGDKLCLQNGNKYLNIDWLAKLTLGTTASSGWTFDNGAMTTLSLVQKDTYYLGYDTNFAVSKDQKSVSLYEVLIETPKLSVEGLTENTDYTVAFSNIDKKGTGTATITGIGNYAGSSATKTFPVCNLTKHAAVDRDCWTDGNTEYYECSCGEHYYSDALAKNEVQKDSWVLAKYGHDDASHTNAVVAKFGTSGNVEYWYCDRCENYFKASTCAKSDIIEEADTVIPAAVALSDFENLTFNTAEQTPEIIVKDTAGNTVAADVVWYKDDVQTDAVKDAGDYNATVTLSQAGYSDSMDVNLTVDKLNLEDEDVTVTINPVTFIHNGFTQKPAVVVMLGDQVINEDDYDLIWEDEESSLVGKYNLTVKGKNNCEGEVGKEYSILHDWKQTIETASFDNAGRIFDACQVEGCDEEQNIETIYQVNRLDNLADVAYNGNDQTPELNITNTNNDVLVEGQDYTIAWYDITEEETAVSELKNAGNYKAVITLKGDNYDEESTDEVLFNITPYELEDTDVVFGEKTFYDDGSVKRPTVTVTALDTTLEEGVDYDVICDETKEAGEDYTLSVEAKGNFQGTFDTTYDILHNYESKLDKASFDADGSVYNHCQNCGYDEEIENIPQATAELDFATAEYSGSEITLPEILTNLNEDDYDFSWDNNAPTDLGTYTATITLKGDKYEGETQLTFEIVPADLAGASAKAEKSSYHETGSAIEPELIVVDANGNTLVKDVDYEVLGFENNVNVGTASFTISGLGYYQGTKTGTFFITEAERVEEQVEDIEITDGKLVAKLSEEETNEILDALEKGGLETVTVNATTDSKVTVKEAKVELTPELVNAVLEKGVVLEIKTDVGSISVDKAALQAVSKLAGDNPISFSAKASSVTKTSGTYNFAFTYDKDGTTKKVTNLGTGKATLSVPLPAGLKTGTVIYKSSNKTYSYKYNTVAKKDALKYTTSSLTTAYVMSKPAANKAIGKSVQKSTVSSLKITALKTGKMKLTWKKGQGNIPTGYYIYRSTKKSSGFKKIGYVKYTSKKSLQTLTNAKKLKKGKKYYYKVRGYYKADGKTYYTKYSTVKYAKCKKTRR